jgi:hypothetical protein
MTEPASGNSLYLGLRVCARCLLPGRFRRSDMVVSGSHAGWAGLAGQPGARFPSPRPGRCAFCCLFTDWRDGPHEGLPKLQHHRIKAHMSWRTPCRDESGQTTSAPFKIGRGSERAQLRARCH